MAKARAIRGAPAAVLAVTILALTPTGVSADLGPDAGRPATKATPTYRLRGFTIVNLRWSLLPWTGTALQPLNPTYLQDRNGVLLWRHSDGKLYYHPVHILEKALPLLNSYVRTGIASYLTRAKAIASKLRQIGTHANVGLYLPYPFAWTHDSYRLLSPWYSGMAQGMALSFYSRLYRITGESSYLSTARLLFRTLMRLSRAFRPWVAYVDASRYLWIEEYPIPTRPSHVLNGFVFAIYGVYDYWWTTRDGTALTYLRGSLTTVRDSVTRYRVPGGISRYCLCLSPPRSAVYHRIHTRQLWKLAQMTGDSYFQQQGDLFYQDYH